MSYSKPKPKCKRCGKCCYYFSTKGKWLPCRFLLYDKAGKAACLHYRKHIGTHLGNLFYCMLREDVHWNYPGCSYNRKEWPMHPTYK